MLIPPKDWTRIYLRNRTMEMTPSYAFEITSRDARDEPHEIALADAFAETVFQ
jgi:hypothetical protein